MYDRARFNWLAAASFRMLSLQSTHFGFTSTPHSVCTRLDFSVHNIGVAFLLIEPWLVTINTCEPLSTLKTLLLKKVLQYNQNGWNVCTVQRLYPLCVGITSCVARKWLHWPWCFLLYDWCWCCYAHRDLTSWHWNLMLDIYISTMNNQKKEHVTVKASVVLQYELMCNVMDLCILGILLIVFCVCTAFQTQF